MGICSMDKLTLSAAGDHLRRMELRIEQQNERIVKLKGDGVNTIEAVKRLIILRKALNVMRTQLGALSAVDGSTFSSVLRSAAYVAGANDQSQSPSNRLKQE